jgi:hypothetical protein
MVDDDPERLNSTSVWRRCAAIAEVVESYEQLGLISQVSFGIF